MERTGDRNTGGDKKRSPPVKLLSGQLREARCSGGTSGNNNNNGDCTVRLQGSSVPVSLVWMQGTVLEAERDRERDSVVLLDETGTFSVTGLNNIPRGKPCLSPATVPLEFLQPLRLAQPACQSFQEATPGPSSTGPSSTPMEQLQETDDDDVPSDVKEMISAMRRHSRDPLFTSGLEAMMKQFLLLKRNPSALLSAYHTFGKSGSLSTRRAATLLRAARRRGPIIGCQPTAVARRKLPAGSRRRVQAGRPAKQHDLQSNTT